MLQAIPENLSIVRNLNRIVSDRSSGGITLRVCRTSRAGTGITGRCQRSESRRNQFAGYKAGRAIRSRSRCDQDVEPVLSQITRSRSTNRNYVPELKVSNVIRTHLEPYRVALSFRSCAPSARECITINSGDSHVRIGEIFFKPVKDRIIGALRFHQTQESRQRRLPVRIQESNHLPPVFRPPCQSPISRKRYRSTKSSNCHCLSPCCLFVKVSAAYLLHSRQTTVCYPQVLHCRPSWNPQKLVSVLRLCHALL